MQNNPRIPWFDIFHLFLVKSDSWSFSLVQLVILEMRALHSAGLIADIVLEERARQVDCKRCALICVDDSY